MFIKNCIQCNKQFETYKKNKKFCSRACFAKSQTTKVKVNCEICGREVYKIPSRLKIYKHVVCSRKCVGKLSARLNEGKGNFHKKGRISPCKGGRRRVQTNQCIYCGKLIEDYISRDRKYCSRSCMIKDFVKKEVYLKGLSYFKKGDNSPIWNCLECGKEFKHYKRNGKLNCKFCSKKCHTIYQRKHPKKGKKAYRFGKVSHAKYINYKGIWFHSTWESKFAKFLDDKNVKWQYEYKTFDLGNTTYTPDFYLPEIGIYIEVKGYWREDAKKKFKMFKKKYRDNIMVLDEKKLKTLRII